MNDQDYVWYNTGVRQPQIVTAAVLETPRGLGNCVGGATTMTHFTIDFYSSGNLDDYAPWVAEYGLCAPYGKCQCGCGKPTSIAKRNHSVRGWKKGHPVRFIAGHVAINQPKQFLQDRFWEKVDRRGPDECWEWQRVRKGYSYGTLKMGDTHILAHRISYEWHFGPIPDGMHVCHHCDNPPCVNPAHLFLGSHSENMKDMYRKGRHPGHAGELNGQAKLSLEKAKQIRCRRAKGETAVELASEYGVAKTTILKVLRGQSWVDHECDIGNAGSKGGL
jgi:hypothetical protein